MWRSNANFAQNIYSVNKKKMSTILHIETSTDICSVALSEDGKCLYEEIDTNGQSHAQVLAGFVDSVLSFADSHAIPVDAVALSDGPGSYTGLRIGASMAKGVCYGREIPMVAIPTLKLLCTPVLLYHDLPEDALLCPMIDARRMEVYTAVYDRALRPKEDVHAKVVDETSFKEWLDRGPVYFFGNGAEKCKAVLSHPNAHFIDNIKAQAKHMVPLAEMALARGLVEDVAYYTPFYLKEFVPGKSKSLL
jgi:tRNA threonylcarbamoyladenosine biosynthesis protein TsaB